MKPITAEQAIALIKKFQVSNTFGISDDEINSIWLQMEEKPFVYLCEASIDEPFTEGSNRIEKLLKMMKPEVDAMDKTPRSFIILIMKTKKASPQMEEMDAIYDFMEFYEEVEYKWLMNPLEDESYTIMMQMIIVTD